MADITTLTNTVWGNSDKHVDSSIGDGSVFTNSAHTLIYGKIHGADGSDTFRPMGVVQGWSFTEQRQVEEMFEIGSDIRYIIPGRTTGQIAITRMLINGQDLINVLYGKGATSDTKYLTPLRSLKDINTALDLLFVSYYNSGDTTAPNKPHMIRYFDNCWVVARQESISANQVTIAENCTLTYEKIAHISADGLTADAN